MLCNMCLLLGRSASGLLRAALGAPSTHAEACWSQSLCGQAYPVFPWARPQLPSAPQSGRPCSPRFCGEKTEASQEEVAPPPAAAAATPKPVLAELSLAGVLASRLRPLLLPSSHGGPAGLEAP